MLDVGVFVSLESDFLLVFVGLLKSFCNSFLVNI